MNISCNTMIDSNNVPLLLNIYAFRCQIGACGKPTYLVMALMYVNAGLMLMLCQKLEIQNFTIPLLVLKVSSSYIPGTYDKNHQLFIISDFGCHGNHFSHFVFTVSRFERAEMGSCGSWTGSWVAN